LYKLKVEGHFDAAHKLPNYEGKCQRLHGHTWRVKVIVQNKALNDQKMVCDFKEIKDAWEKYDHQYLNDFFEQPTAEVLAKAIWIDLHHLGDVEVTVWESPETSASYYEEK